MLMIGLRRLFSVHFEILLLEVLLHPLRSREVLEALCIIRFRSIILRKVGWIWSEP